MNINDLKLQSELESQSNNESNQFDEKINGELKNSLEQKKFQYKLLKIRKLEKNHNCYTLNFNRQGKILLASHREGIIVYYNGQTIKMLQKLTYPVEGIFYLAFMKQTQQFIYGSVDNSIIILKLDKYSKWTIITILQDHKDWVTCIVMNKNEDLLISGSLDQSVKFWRKIHDQWSCQQTLCLDDNSYSLSLNQQEKKLIQCGFKSLIRVMELKLDNTWDIVQMINVAENGWRLCFINDIQLVFQPRTKDFIELHHFDIELKEFKKNGQTQIQSCEGCYSFFQIQFIKDLKILAVKHGQFLNIFQFRDESNLYLMQTIEFHDLEICGALSDDGKYLAVYDQQTEKIQIMLFRYVE